MYTIDLFLPTSSFLFHQRKCQELAESWSCTLLVDPSESNYSTKHVVSIQGPTYLQVVHCSNQLIQITRPSLYQNAYIIPKFDLDFFTSHPEKLILEFYPVNPDLVMVTAAGRDIIDLAEIDKRMRSHVKDYTFLSDSSAASIFIPIEFQFISLLTNKNDRMMRTIEKNYSVTCRFGSGPGRGFPGDSILETPMETYVILELTGPREDLQRAYTFVMTAVTTLRNGHRNKFKVRIPLALKKDGNVKDILSGPRRDFIREFQQFTKSNVFIYPHTGNANPFFHVEVLARDETIQAYVEVLQTHLGTV